MPKLPAHGRVACNACFGGCDNVEFDRTQRVDGAWRITANPLGWGNADPEIVVLGFSKGPTQAGALATEPHDEIAYKGGRTQMGKILRHVGLIPSVADSDLRAAVSALIEARTGRFHFGSLIRCTVERLTRKGWEGTGGGMLDKFVATPFGSEVAGNCSMRHLGQLPTRTKLVIMFGLGSKLNYVKECRTLFQMSQGGIWQWINEVAYTNGRVTVVHVEHFKSQGAYIPQWLGQRNHQRQRWGVMAQEAVKLALSAVVSH